jgi:hypothetical protein
VGGIYTAATYTYTSLLSSCRNARTFKKTHCKTALHLLNLAKRAGKEPVACQEVDELVEKHSDLGVKGGEPHCAACDWTCSIANRNWAQNAESHVHGVKHTNKAKEYELLKLREAATQHRENRTKHREDKCAVKQD